MRKQVLLTLTAVLLLAAGCSNAALEKPKAGHAGEAGACGKSYDGTAIVHSAGLDIDVTIDDNQVKNSDLKVCGF
jgi:hypothetical protein